MQPTGATTGTTSQTCQLATFSSESLLNLTATTTTSNLTTPSMYSILTTKVAQFQVSVGHSIFLEPMDASPSKMISHHSPRETPTTVVRYSTRISMQGRLSEIPKMARFSRLSNPTCLLTVRSSQPDQALSNKMAINLETILRIDQLPIQRYKFLTILNRVYR